MFEVRVHEDCTNISGRVYRINNLESGEAGRIYSIRGLCFRLESPELSGCIIPKDIQSEIQSYKQRDQQREMSGWNRNNKD
jgi:hypothetical protein